MNKKQIERIVAIISRDKFAYVLFGANIINGALLIFIVPQFFSTNYYALLLIQVFSLQFASLFEAGSVLYFLNLVKGRALTKYEAQALIKKVSTIQLIFALTGNILYNYLYLTDIGAIGFALISSHIFFSLRAVPIFFSASLEAGYEVIQKFKAMQALLVMSLLALFIIVSPVEGILIYSYSAASVITFIILKLKHPAENNTSVYSLEIAIKYSFHIVSSSIGWLFVNFIFANSLQQVPDGKIGQLWLIYRMADNLLGSRFANRISEYMKDADERRYFISFALVSRKEVMPFIIFATPTIIMSLSISSIDQVLNFGLWLLLNRINSVFNILILPDYHHKNIINTLILVVSGLSFLYLFAPISPILTLNFMWLVLCFSNLLYGSGVKK